MHKIAEYSKHDWKVYKPATLLEEYNDNTEMNPRNTNNNEINNIMTNRNKDFNGSRLLDKVDLYGKCTARSTSFMLLDIGVDDVNSKASMHSETFLSPESSKPKYFRKELSPKSCRNSFVEKLDNITSCNNSIDCRTSSDDGLEREKSLLLEDEINSTSREQENIVATQQEKESVHQQKKPRSRKDHVMFSDDIEIREYAITYGDHPNCKDGLPIALDWDYAESYTLPFEYICKERMVSYQSPTRLSFSERRKRLQKVSPGNYKEWRDECLLGDKDKRPFSPMKSPLHASPMRSPSCLSPQSPSELDSVISRLRQSFSQNSVLALPSLDSDSDDDSDSDSNKDEDNQQAEQKRTEEPIKQERDAGMNQSTFHLESLMGSSSSLNDSSSSLLDSSSSSLLDSSSSLILESTEDKKINNNKTIMLKRSHHNKHYKSPEVEVWNWERII